MDKIQKKLAWVRSFRKRKSGYKKLRQKSSLDDILPDRNQTFKRYSQPELSFTNPLYKQTGKGRRRRLKHKRLRKRRIRRIHRRKVHIRRRRRKIRR